LIGFGIWAVLFSIAFIWMWCAIKLNEEWPLGDRLDGYDD